MVIMDLDLSETEFFFKKCVLCRLGLHFLIFGYTFSLKNKKETHRTHEKSEKRITHQPTVL